MNLWCHQGRVSEAPLTMNGSAVTLFDKNNKESMSPIHCCPDSSAGWHQRLVSALLLLALWETYQYIQVWNVHIHSITCASSLEWIFTCTSLLASWPSCTTIHMCQNWTWNLYNFEFNHQVSIIIIHIPTFETTNGVCYISTDQCVMGAILWRERQTARHILCHL